ncbi:5-oxoprolinase subunit PxpB [Parapedobacter koreensis]|uniref:Inhibitor of KinA n=1 Tax=Parapedobacter koreensis TaxID=332977 RepID=A0A1H7MUE0_9SPHI|nr:5-oxoprolinase subunit PxpB [Parapedobacter koreensis]SEL14418.1 inhibitor of KinA [Parapedobacter koreensis]
MDSYRKKADTFVIYALSEYAVTLDFGEELRADHLQQISRFNTLLHDNPFDGFRASVPAYTTLTLFFDPMVVIQASTLTGIHCFERIFNYLNTLKYKETGIVAAEAMPIMIPVCYGDRFGPDLEEVAQEHGMTPDELIQLHRTAIYRVHLIGFTPGFAYLGGLPDRLATPRRASPRSAVPAGSVGIAGKQTGIYSLETPGGWQIIGRTPLRLFDPHRAQPTLLKAGDTVVFQAITPHQFESDYKHDAYPYS